MRHVTLVLALVLSLTLAVSATAAASVPEDPVREVLESQPNLGPYCTPNG